MYGTQSKWKQRSIAAIVAAFILGGAGAQAEEDAKTDKSSMEKSVMETLKQCQQVSSSCAETAKSATGVLVFPNVVKADIIVGGSGGKGALVENGKITGYYNIGAASAGLQAGIESASQVYIFRSVSALAKLKDGSEWNVGATADVTLVENDSGTRGATGNILAYVFDAKGLHAGVSLDVFHVWKDDKVRPQARPS